MKYVITNKETNQVVKVVDNYAIQDTTIITPGLHFADKDQWNIFEISDEESPLFIPGRKHYDGVTITDAPEYVDNVELKTELDLLKAKNSLLETQLAQTNADMAELINYITGGNV